MSTTPRVAVVAIHGVADQQPQETVRRIADMLLSSKLQGVRYDHFEEAVVRVPVSGVERGLPSEKGPRKWKMKTLVPGRGSDTADDLAYTRDQIEDYVPDQQDAVYETVRLSGTRKETTAGNVVEQNQEGAASSVEVHVYEMYWADLSRASSSVMQLVVEFYQLLSYLCVIGRKTLDFALAVDKSPTWKWLRWFQLVAEQSLTIAVPVLNLCLLGLASSWLVGFAEGHYGVVLTTVLAVVLFGSLCLFLYAKRERLPGWRYLALFVAGSAAISAVVYFWAHGMAVNTAREAASARYLAGVAWVASAVGIVLLMFVYHDRRQGALPIGVFFTALVTGIYLQACINWPEISGGPGPRLLSAAASTAVQTFKILLVVWGVFGLSMFMALVTAGLGSMEARAQGRDGAPIRRAMGTVLATLGLPALLAAVMNLLLWNALYLAGQKWMTAMVQTPLRRRPESLRAFSHHLITYTCNDEFALFMTVLGLLGFLALWLLLPSIVSELSPPRRPYKPSHTQWLADNLDRGLKMAWFGCLALASFMAMSFVFEWSLLRDLTSSPNRVGTPAKLMTMATGVAVLAFGGSKYFAWLALGGRAIVDVALDVANWLRLHPKNRNPKARIMARFVGLMRFLKGWRDPQDGQRGYSGIVIIAHSQGTVIAAETLRYMRAEHEDWRKAFDPGDESGALPISLFTMGSPLGQLYAVRFPHQYSWAATATRQELGVKQWWNDYRSGDYVGRWLCSPDLQGTRSFCGRREISDRCIGPGAHTHYWDDTAPEVVEDLDRLIESAR